MAPTPLLIPIEEAAHDYLRCGKTKLYELLNAGEIRAVAIGRRRLIPHHELVAYVNRLSESL